MKTLIIFAHPGTKGHCTTFLKDVVGHLKKQGIDYGVLDLYKMKYDPVLHDCEHYTSGGYELSRQNKNIQKKIEAADKLIVIYPVWWGSMPAILKGFFDRVFTARWAYRFRKILGVAVPIPLLKGKKAAVFITHGAPWWAVQFIIRKKAANIVRKEVLEFCGIKTKVFIVPDALSLTEKNKAVIKKKVKKGLDWLYR